MFGNLTSALRNNPNTIGGLLLGAIITIGFSVWIVGCTPKVDSILKPGTKVDAAGLSGEAIQEQGELDKTGNALKQQIADYQSKAATFNAEFAQRTQTLQQLEAQRAQIMNIAGGVISNLASGNFNPVGLAGTGVSLLALLGGVGAMADKSSRTSVVTNLRQQLNSTTSTNTTGTPAVTPGTQAAATPPAPAAVTATLNAGTAPAPGGAPAAAVAATPLV